MKRLALADLQEHFKEAVKNNSPFLDEVLTPSGAHAERLGVYRYAYRARLEESLTEDFEALESILGAELFTKLIKKYVDENPSQSWTLSDYSAGFSSFLKENVQEKSVSDLAAFEWIKIKCTLGPAAQVFDPQSLINAGEDEWVVAEMKIVPSLFIFSSLWPMNDLKQLMSYKKSNGEIFYYAIFRSAYGLQILQLSDVEMNLLEQMNSGKNFGSLAEEFGAKGVSIDVVATSVATWVQEGLIEKVVFGDSKVS